MASNQPPPEPTEEEWKEAEHQIKHWKKGCGLATTHAIGSHDFRALVDAFAFGFARLRERQNAR